MKNHQPELEIDSVKHRIGNVHKASRWISRLMLGIGFSSGLLLAANVNDDAASAQAIAVVGIVGSSVANLGNKRLLPKITNQLIGDFAIDHKIVDNSIGINHTYISVSNGQLEEVVTTDHRTFASMPDFLESFMCSTSSFLAGSGALQSFGHSFYNPESSTATMPQLQAVGAYLLVASAGLYGYSEYASREEEMATYLRIDNMVSGMSYYLPDNT